MRTYGATTEGRTMIVMLVLSLVALAMAAYAVFEPTHNARPVQISAYERVIQNRVVRCAYQVWPPFLAKDPNTGKMSGVYFDLFERMGRDTGIKFDWAEEVASASIFEGLATQRYDMICSPISPSAERSLLGYFSRPIGYVPFYLYVRGDDARFDGDYERANNETVSMVSLDGDLTAAVTQEEFPKARKVSLPNMTSGAELLMNVADKKADGAVCASSVAEAFMANNTGKLKQVVGLPLRYPSLTVAMPVGEDRLRMMIDTALTHYIEIGVVDKILNSYGLDEAKILRADPPYIEPVRGRRG